MLNGYLSQCFSIILLYLPTNFLGLSFIKVIFLSWHNMLYISRTDRQTKYYNILYFPRPILSCLIRICNLTKINLIKVT